jgi:hypothetical protein
MFSASRYPGIRLEALEGYTEDKRSKRQFLLPYSVLAVAAIIVLLSIFTRHAIHKSAMSLGWFFVGGLCFVVILGAIALAYRSAPEGVIELLYVDEDSRTFFRNIYAVPE